jgi:flagellar hook-length control protein FliK
VSHAQVIQKSGGVEFQMRLDPPDLGRVQVQIVSRGDEVHGQVLVASEAVRQVMESQLPELRQRLEAAGVNVQQFTVATDPSGGGSRNPYRDAPASDTAAAAGTTTAPSTAVRSNARAGPAAGSLDVMA